MLRTHPQCLRQETSGRLWGPQFTIEFFWAYRERDLVGAPLDVELVGRLAILGLDLVACGDQTVGAEMERTVQSVSAGKTL